MCAFSKKPNRSQKYPTEKREALQRLLDSSSLPRDALPYTDEFSRLKEQFQTQFDQKLSDWEFWRAMATIGKRGGRSTNRKRKAPPTPKLSKEDQLEILRLMPDGMGNRDHLPYTSKFDEIYARFTDHTGRKLTQHEFWRGVSRVGKLSRKPRPLFDAAPIGGLPEELVQVLERTNPWWRAEPMKVPERFRRWAFAEVLRRLDSEIAPVIVIRGPRQVGKSTIQTQIIEYLLNVERVAPQRILRVQFDEVPGLGLLANPIESIVQWFEKNVLKQSLNASARRGEPVYLLFDELQNLKKWSEQLKSMVDNSTARTFVTGSSALRIAKGRDSLAGRMNTIELGPLRLDEIAGIRGLSGLTAFSPGNKLEDWKAKSFWLDLVSHGEKSADARDKAFIYFSTYGGYPICHKGSESDQSVLADQIVREVVGRTFEHDPVYGRGRPNLERRLLEEAFRVVCRYAGQQVRIKEMAAQIRAVLHGGITEQKTEEAIQFFVDSMLVHRIPPLELLLKKQGASTKLCLCDHFIRNGFLQETIPLSPAELESAHESIATMAGHIIESSVGFTLACTPGLDVSWFPRRTSEPEVDFVLTLGTHRIPIEVKYTRSPPKLGDLEGLRAFISRTHYNAPFGLTITRTFAGPITDDIIAIPAASFLLLQ